MDSKTTLANSHNGQEVKVLPGTELSPEQEIIEVSQSEIASGLWIIGITKDGLSFSGKLYRAGILQTLSDMGYFKREEPGGGYHFIREMNNIIAEVSPSEIKDHFYHSRIASIAPLGLTHNGVTLEISTEKLRESYLKQAHLIFNESFLEHLHTHSKPILKDDRDEMFFPFRNGIVKVSRSSIEALTYSDLENVCIWQDHIIEHSFSRKESGGHFEKFIQNVCSGADDRIRAMRSAIGYLLHNIAEPSKGQVVIAYDESPAKKGQPEGGTGKGLFANSVKQLRNTSKIDGKKFDNSDRFRWQSVTRQTQLVWIDDVHTNFDFAVLHSCSTDGWNVEKKHRDEFYIPPEESPKVLIASNTILTNQGATNRRRQFIIEFSDHYSRHIKTGTEEPIRDEHKGMFFSRDDWDTGEWQCFFTYMMGCAQFYLKNGLVPYEFKNLKRNQLLQSTSEDFSEWIIQHDIKPGKRYNNTELCKDFREIYYGSDSDFKQTSFTAWMKRMAGIYGWDHKISRSNGDSMIQFYDN